MSQPEDYELSPNALCPCASGLRYGSCCKRKRFKWCKNDAGETYRAVPISPEMMAILDLQAEKFVEAYGRQPGPGDPVFFDVTDEEWDKGWNEVIRRLAEKECGIELAQIYAVQKTDRIITVENQDLLPDNVLDEWEAAVGEFEAKVPTIGANTTLHKLVINSLVNLDPRVATKDFRKVVRKLLSSLNAVFALGYLNREFKFIPDAYLIDTDQKFIVIFEVEDTHLLTKSKLNVYLNLWSLITDATDWQLALIVIDRYGVPRPLDCQALWQAI